MNYPQNGQSKRYQKTLAGLMSKAERRDTIAFVLGNRGYATDTDRKYYLYEEKIKGGRGYRVGLVVTSARDPRNLTAREVLKLVAFSWRKLGL